MRYHDLLTITATSNKLILVAGKSQGKYQTLQLNCLHTLIKHTNMHIQKIIICITIDNMKHAIHRSSQLTFNTS